MSTPQNMVYDKSRRSPRAVLQNVLYGKSATFDRVVIHMKTEIFTEQELGRLNGQVAFDYFARVERISRVPSSGLLSGGP